MSSLDPNQALVSVKIILSAIGDSGASVVILSGDIQARKYPFLIYACQSELRRPSKSAVSRVSAKPQSIEPEGGMVDQIRAKNRILTQAKNPNVICAWDSAAQHP